ncbi:unnamed protein product [Caenorhabditis brenneri]
MAHGWNDEWYENESNYFEHHDEEYGLRTSLYFLELVNPVQKTMGCAEYKCINRKSIIPKNQVPTMNFDIICLFGPESTIDIGEMKNGERGEAGSKCEEEGGEDDDGLSSQFALHCKYQLYITPLLGHLRLRDDSKMKTWLLLSLLFFPAAVCFQGIDKEPKWVTFNEGHEKIFVDALNEMRREWAREQRTPNMWKLEWSDELVQTAKSLPADCNSLKPGSNYRFSVIPLESSRKWYEEETNYLAHHDEEYALHTTAHWAEWINPVQKTVGCAEYNCKRKSIIPENRVPTMNFGIICLFGPESTFGNGDEEKGEAGSKCEEEDGEDEDGLCVPSGSPGSSILFNISIVASLVLLVSMIFD